MLLALLSICLQIRGLTANAFDLNGSVDLTLTILAASSGIASAGVDRTVGPAADMYPAAAITKFYSNGLN